MGNTLALMILCVIIAGTVIAFAVGAMVLVAIVANLFG
jgi:hypothetical protein